MKATKFTNLTEDQKEQARDLYELNAKLERQLYGEPRTTQPLAHCSFYLDADGNVDDEIFDVPPADPEAARDAAEDYQAELDKIAQIKIK